MLQKQLNKNKFLQYATSCIEILDVETEYDRMRLQYGLQLYRKGHVYNVLIDDYNILEATVEDEEGAFLVSLDLLDYEKNRCECFNIEMCEHMLAVLFYCASSYGSVGELLNVWKQHERPALVRKGVQKASSLLRKTTYEENDLGSWFQYFDEQYDKYKKSLKASYYTKKVSHTIYYEYYKKLEANAPKKKELKEFFCIHALLFSLEKLFESLEVEGSSSIFDANHTTQNVHNLLDDLDEMTFDISPTNHEESLKRMVQQVENIVAKKQTYFPSAFNAYCVVWTRLLHTSGLTESRIADVQKMIKENGKGEQLHYELIHLFFLLGNDDAAMQQLHSLPHVPFHFLQDWLTYLNERQEEERIQKWLLYWYQSVQQQLPHMSYYEAKKTVMYLLPLFEEYMKEGYDSILQELLPFSYVYYCDYVIDKQQYHTWAELQLFVNVDPFYEAAEYVKVVEKHDRAVLIPLYYHWISHYIAMKNRPSYKHAVRYLKKLRTIYRKEKRLSEWDRYILHLSTTHSRLRAFQEELKKGKLLDAN
jgi:hypothetical protein